MKKILSFLFVACAFAVTAMANPISELDYQGRVLLNDLPFTGNGYFKFTITDVGNTSNYWANDGTGTGEPAAHLTNSVFNGVFSTILGQSPMAAINATIFNSGADLYLRVWFSTATNSFSAMLPAQKIVSSAYAINAGRLGGSSAAQIQSNSVAAATNAITLAGDITGLPQANSIAAGVIVDADVNAAAAIAGTKVVQGTIATRGTLQIAAGSTGTAAIATGHPSLNAFSTVNSIVAGAPNSGFGIVASNNVGISVSGTNVVINSPFLPAFDNVIWVSTNGTSAGPGTIEQPYSSPQEGYEAAAGRYSGIPSAVVMAGGSYSSGLTMSSGSVHVIGLHRAEIDTLTIDATSSGISGLQTIEGLVVINGTAVTPPGGNNVRFHNCRLEGGTTVYGFGITRTIFQDCRLLASAFAGGYALGIGTVSGLFAGAVGVYQSSLENRDAAVGTIEIGFLGLPAPNVQGVEVIGCEIVNTEGVTGPAVQDWTPFHGIGFPLNLFTHNYIKGPFPAAGPGYGAPAIADPAAPPFPGAYPPGTGPFLGIYNNTIMGHVGSVNGPGPHEQWYGNNMIYGISTWPAPPSVAGWINAGGGTGIDPISGDVQHEVPGPYVLPFPPDLWDD